MKYLLSTIADVDFVVKDETEIISYVRKTAPVAKEYNLGLELAEFCISENLDEKYDEVLPHFEANRNEFDDVVLHAPYNDLYPHAIDKKMVDVAFERYDFTWKLCEKYNIKKIVAHANYVECLFYPEWFIARQIEFWNKFLSTHPGDITICLENVMEGYPELMTEIVKGVDDERLRICLDIGHANLTSISPTDWLKECAPYISHYHLHNNNGPVAGTRSSLGDKHASLPNGVIDMYSLLTLAEKLTPNATAAIESYDIQESAEWLKEKGFI